MSQISHSLNDLCAKGLSFVPFPVNYHLGSTSRMRARYMFKGKFSPPQNDL